MRRLISLTVRKLSVLFDGRPILIPIAFAVYALCLAVVASVCTADHSDSVRMAVVDECKGALSSALVDSLKSTPGFVIFDSDSFEEAAESVSDGSAEAILEIEPGYDEHISDESISSLIRLTTAPGSVSAELIRETVAGKLLSQRAEAGVLSELENEGFDTSAFDSYKSEAPSGTIYTITTVGGGNTAQRAVFGQGFPGYEGFAALAIMLILLTVSRQFADPTAKLVSNRLLVPAGSGMLGFLSDLLALHISALVLSVTAYALAPERSGRLISGLVGYSFFITGLCLVLTSVISGGRLDLASPFIALVTSILGGCFAETGTLSPALSLISKFTPQGQLISFVHGDAIFLALLFAESAALFCAAFIAQRRRKGN